VDFERLKGLMKRPVLFDGRNVIDGKKAVRNGFEYEGIGRGRGGPREDAPGGGDHPAGSAERRSRRSRSS
jgi:hypothetical protein